MAKSSAGSAQARPHYTNATERAFRLALESLETTLPHHHGALAALVDEGRFDSLDAIVTILDEGGER